jgi:hypothetical protein
MSVKQAGQVLVAGDGDAGDRRNRSTIRFIGLTTRKKTAAPMMIRVSAALMKSRMR